MTVFGLILFLHESFFQEQQNFSELKIKLSRFKIKIECTLGRLIQDNFTKGQTLTKTTY
jgi:hypothetical protein